MLRLLHNLCWSIFKFTDCFFFLLKSFTVTLFSYFYFSSSYFIWLFYNFYFFIDSLSFIIHCHYIFISLNMVFINYLNIFITATVKSVLIPPSVYFNSNFYCLIIFLICESLVLFPTCIINFCCWKLDILNIYTVEILGTDFSFTSPWFLIVFLGVGGGVFLWVLKFHHLNKLFFQSLFCLFSASDVFAQILFPCF